MKKSKHFRKDVIMARVIAGVLVIVLIALLVFAVSLLTKPSGNNNDTQNTQSTQNTQGMNKDSESEETEPEPEPEVEPETEPEVEPETEPEENQDDTVYVTTTSQVRLRKEPNTECATLVLIEADTKLEVLEKLDGWYKVIHNGQEGYVSATYVEVVEE